MPDKPRSRPQARTQAPASRVPGQLQWLVRTGEVLQTSDSRVVEVWELQHQNDDTVLSAWAKHLRNQYCLDEQLDPLRKGTNYSRAEYLINIKFPDRAEGLGPSIRAGDFAEILVADYVEFLLQYWVPRTRYANKTIRNESAKGSDVIGFKLVGKGKDSRQDALAIFETKTDFSGRGSASRLQDAVDDSAKDPTRKAESLNAIKQRFLELERLSDAEKVERFQNPVDRPYQEHYGAVAVFSTRRFDRSSIAQTDASSHPSANLALLVIHGSDLMKLVHELYLRAANEA